MSIHTLNSLKEKHNEDFVKSFLSKPLVITEKLDTYRILFQKKNDSINFYKKDNKVIDIIERTLSDIWEEPINEINHIIYDCFSEIPEGYRFGVAYIPDERPLLVPYKNLPKYILTDIINENGKALSLEEVENWSAKLCLARPPYIFKGTLTEEQKNNLINYSNSCWEDLKEDNLGELIKNNFGKTYSGNDIIEGIIISNDESIAKIVSYEFELISEAYNKLTPSRDFYDLLIIKLNNFLSQYTLPYLQENNSTEQRYIDTICDIFNKFVSKDYFFEGLSHKDLQSPQWGYCGQLNKSFITNENTKELLENNKLFENIFKIILSSLRKTKKPYGLLDSYVVESFNTFVNIINNKSIKALNEEVTEKPEEKTKSDNDVVKNIAARSYSDMDNMRIIASIQRAFNPKHKEVTKGEQKCIVYFTSLLPFTNKQLENINTLYDKWKLPIVIASISNKKRITGNKFFISDTLVKAQLQSICQFYGDKVKAMLMMDSWNLYELFEYCRPKFEPILLITDPTKSSDFSMQLYFNEEIMGGRIGIEKDFNIGELDNDLEKIAFRAIENGNAVSYNELCPESIWGFFNNIRSEYLSWNSLKNKPSEFIENKFE